MCRRVNNSMRNGIVLSLLVVCALAFPALAQEHNRPQSLDRVLPEIRRTTPGTFYDAEGPFLMPGGQVTYRIKWMTPDGRIVWFYADARSGQVLGSAQHSPQERRSRNDAPTDRLPAPDWRDNRRDRDNWRDRNDRDGSGWDRGRGNGDWGRGGGGGGGGGGGDRSGGRGGHDRRGGG
jgi:hypothetical protein